MQSKSNAMEWMPIESAPRDWDFLVYGTITSANPSEAPRSFIRLAHQSSMYHGINDSVRKYDGEITNYTHWMPLPQPPVKTK